MIKYEKLFSIQTVDNFELERIPKEVIIRTHIRKLAGILNDNKDELPIKISEKPMSTFETELKLEINIISDEEIERLRDIEAIYNEMRWENRNDIKI